MTITKQSLATQITELTGAKYTGTWAKGQKSFGLNQWLDGGSHYITIAESKKFTMEDIKAALTKLGIKFKPSTFTNWMSGKREEFDTDLDIEITYIKGDA